MKRDYRQRLIKLVEWLSEWRFDVADDAETLPASAHRDTLLDELGELRDRLDEEVAALQRGQRVDQGDEP